MKYLKIIFLSAISLAIISCAQHPQELIALSPKFATEINGKIGVKVIIPKPNTHLVGAGCLLCIAVAEAANSSLTKYTKTLDYTDLKESDQIILESLERKGAEVKIIAEPFSIKKLKKFKTKELNYAKKNHTPLKQKFDIDKLFVLNLTSIGVYRPYANYIPTGAPTGLVEGVFYLLDLNTNKYEMYQTIDFKINTQGEWDESPNYPGITNAFYQAVEQAKDKIRSTLE